MLPGVNWRLTDLCWLGFVFKLVRPLHSECNLCSNCTIQMPKGRRLLNYNVPQDLQLDIHWLWSWSHTQPNTCLSDKKWHFLVFVKGVNIHMEDKAFEMVQDKNHEETRAFPICIYVFNFKAFPYLTLATFHMRIWLHWAFTNQNN